MTRRMYLDPAKGMEPHSGEHDENEFCLSVYPKCIPHSDAPEPSWTVPPDHYSTGSGMQPWQVWEAFNLDPWEANLIKYVLRSGKKDGESKLKDLVKAKNYLLYLIDREENRE